MANDSGRDVFEVDERPTRPGNPPRTKTSRWRAVTSAAIERGFGRLSEGDFDQGNLPEPEATRHEAEATTASGVIAVEAPAEPSVVVAEEPEAAARPAPVATGPVGPRGTVRLRSRQGWGPTGTVRIPARTSAAPSVQGARRGPRTWPRPYVVLVGLLAVAQLLYLAFATEPPVVGPATNAPMAPPVATAAPVPEPMSSTQAVDEPADAPPAPVVTPGARTPKAPAKARGRRAGRDGASVF